MPTYTSPSTYLPTPIYLPMYLSTYLPIAEKEEESGDHTEADEHAESVPALSERGRAIHLLTTYPHSYTFLPLPTYLYLPRSNIFVLPPNTHTCPVPYLAYPPTYLPTYLPAEEELGDPTVPDATKEKLEHLGSRGKQLKLCKYLST